MDLDAFLDQLAAVFLIASASFSLAAGIGLLRFPDVLARMHAATKPQVVGLMLVLGAIALSERSWAVLLTLLPVLLFQMMTAPISAHMIGRAGYRAGNIDDDHLYSDELDEAIDQAQEERARHEREAGS